VQRQIPLGHPVDEARNSRFVIVGREGGREPQTKRPRRGQRGAPGKRRVTVQNILGGGAIDHVVGQFLARHAELHALHLLRSHLKGDLFRVRDEDAIPAVGQIERDVLVSLLARGAAVGVPDIDDLPVLGKGGEPFAEAVDDLANAKRQLVLDVAIVGVALQGGQRRGRAIGLQ